MKQHIRRGAFAGLTQLCILAALLYFPSVYAENTRTSDTLKPVQMRVAIIGHLYSLLVEEHSHDAKPFNVDEHLNALVSEIESLQVDAVFLLGDVTNNATVKEWGVVREAFARLPAPLYVLPGNHDMGKGLEAFLEAGGEGSRSVVVGDTKFVLLGHESFPGKPTSDLTEFIASELEDYSEYREVVLMMHFLRRGQPGWEQDIVPLLKGRVSKVFTGDLVWQHIKARTDLDSNIRYISSSIRFKGEGAPVFLLWEQTGEQSRIVARAVPLDLMSQWYEDPKEMESSRDRMFRVVNRVPSKVLIGAVVVALITGFLSLLGLLGVWRKFRQTN